MLGLAWLLYFAFGVVMSAFAPLVTPIIRDLNISYSQMGFILGAYPLTYVVVATIAGAVMDRWGIRRSLLFGILVIGVSACLRYFAIGFSTMYIFAAIFGLGGPMISVGCPKTISLWFTGKERAIAVSVYTTGPTVGRLAVLSLTNAVVMPLVGDSWRMTFVVYGMVAFTAGAAWLILARDVKTSTEKGMGIVRVFVDLIKIRKVQIILALGFLNMAIANGFSNWLPKLLENGGLSPEIAGFASSLPILAGLPAVLVIPRLTPLRMRNAVVIAGGLLGAIVLFLIATSKGGTLVTGLLLFGIARQCTTPILMLMLMDSPEIGPAHMGSVGGMFFCIAEAGGFAGPAIMGATVDMTGGFLTGVSLLAGFSMLMAVMALFLKGNSTQLKAQV